MTIPESHIQLTATIIRRAYGKDGAAEALQRWKEAVTDEDPSIAAVWRRVWFTLEGRSATS